MRTQNKKSQLLSNNILSKKKKKNLNSRTGFICTARFKWGKLETALSDESHNVFCNVQCTQGTGNMLVDF